MQVLLILALVIAILAVVFAIQNAVPVTVSFLAWQFEGSFALVLLITLALGVLISLLASVPSMVKRHDQLSHLQRKVQELEISHQAVEHQTDETTQPPLEEQSSQ